MYIILVSLVPYRTQSEVHNRVADELNIVIKESILNFFLHFSLLAKVLVIDRLLQSSLKLTLRAHF
jgi:hypothetical protein